MTDTVRTYIHSLEAEQIVSILAAAGHSLPTEDLTDASTLRGYLLCMVTQGSITLLDDHSPVTGRSASDIETERAEALTRAEGAKTRPTRTKYQEQAADLHVELHTVPAVRVQEVERRQMQAERWLESTLKGWLEEGEEARAKLVDEMQLSTRRAVNALEWMGGKAAAMHLANLAARVLELEAGRRESEEPLTLLQAAEEVAEELRYYLLENLMTRASSSPFANACLDAERAAASTFVCYLKRRFPVAR